jgi:prevent-host-death family protein
MMTQISVSETSRNLSHWINRASYGREIVVITSRGRAKAVMMGVDTFEDLIGLGDYAERDRMPLEQLREEFRQALIEAGYRTREDIVHLVHEVKAEIAAEQK